MPTGSADGIATITIAGSGRKEFGKWSYTKPGIYHYTISEVNTGVSGYTYDTTVYTITDTVTVVDGQLVLSRIVTNNLNKQVKSYDFINKYSSGSNGPKTGDDSPITLYIVLLSVAGIAVLLSVWYLLSGRRHRNNEHKM